MPLLRRSASVLTLCLAVPLSACSYGHGHDDDYYYGDDEISCGDDIEQSTIDTDELLDVEAGVGAGAFIEYEAGGTYRVTTACDADNGGDCYWDIVVRPLDGALISAGPIDLESEDSLGFGGDELRMIAFTGRDFDGFTVQTEAGAGLEVDALLDSSCGNRYLFWVGDGALHSGAPSNPIDLIPSAP
jgi:hypothetical protein